MSLLPESLRSRFRRDVSSALASAEAAPVVTDAEIANLPPLVQTYLRRVGVVGRPHVRNVHVRFRADMRGSPDAGWMHCTAEQYSVFQPMQRYFFMKAWKLGVPVDVLHRYAGNAATMQARIAGLVPIIDMSGPEMTKSETVTVLNDMCVLAPGALVDAPVSWVTLDERRVRAVFTNAGHRVAATLTFNAEGDLVDFLSEDRSMAEGGGMRRLPWTTPLSEYCDFGCARLASHGDACWTDGKRTWTYGRFTLESVKYNVGLGAGGSPVARF